MQSTTVSERWIARPAHLEVADFFSLLGAEPFALLYGDGPEGRWIIHGEDPLRVLDSPDLAEVPFERSGDVPPILPDFIGFIGYVAWGVIWHAITSFTKTPEDSETKTI